MNAHLCFLIYSFSSHFFPKSRFLWNVHQDEKKPLHEATAFLLEVRGIEPLTF